MFGERLLSNRELYAEMVARMLKMKNVTNKFATEVEEGSWNWKKLPFKPSSSNDLLDFPEISLNDLKILFTGTYQLGQAIAYLGEIARTDGDVSDIKVHQLKDQKGLQVIKTEVHSKYRSQVMWHCYIKYRESKWYQGYSRLRKHLPQWAPNCWRMLSHICHHLLLSKSSSSRKNLQCVKSQTVQGNKKTVHNGKLELKVDFWSVIVINTSKIMICYLLLTRIIKSNMIFMNFWHIGDFYWHKEIFIGTN